MVAGDSARFCQDRQGRPEPQAKGQRALRIVVVALGGADGVSEVMTLGDRIPRPLWQDCEGKSVTLLEDRFGGRPAVLLFCRDLAQVAQARQVRRLLAAQAALEALGAAVFAVVPGPPAGIAGLAQRLPRGARLLADPGGTASEAALGDSAARLLLLDENHRVEALFDAAREDLAEAVLAYCRARPGFGPPSLVPSQAPALVVPRVLDEALCAQVLAAWDSGQRFAGGLSTSEGGHQTLRQDIKVREDVALPDAAPLTQTLFAAFRRRLFPEIEKAFAFRVTRSESLRIGCYHGERKGCFRAHRDNLTPGSAHRRFALSLNLNTGAYEGGALWFPEYGPQRYAPPAGGAVVFSCSLLHEALPVTRGRRFGLFAFFFGEAEEQLRRRLNPGRSSPTVG